MPSVTLKDEAALQRAAQRTWPLVGLGCRGQDHKFQSANLSLGSPGYYHVIAEDPEQAEEDNVIEVSLGGKASILFLY